MQDDECLSKRSLRVFDSITIQDSISFHQIYTKKFTPIGQSSFGWTYNNSPGPQANGIFTLKKKFRNAYKKMRKAQCEAPSNENHTNKPACLKKSFNQKLRVANRRKRSMYQKSGVNPEKYNETHQETKMRQTINNANPFQALISIPEAKRTFECVKKYWEALRYSKFIIEITFPGQVFKDHVLGGERSAVIARMLKGGGYRHHRKM
jgi:hypothetical protein